MNASNVQKQAEKAANKVGTFFKGAFKKIEAKFDKMIQNEMSEIDKATNENGNHS